MSVMWVRYRSNSFGGAGGYETGCLRFNPKGEFVCLRMHNGSGQKASPQGETRWNIRLRLLLGGGRQ